MTALFALITCMALGAPASAYVIGFLCLVIDHMYDD